MMPNGELGYVFKSAVTANGCLMLCITPHARRRDFHSKVYVFTADVDRGAGRDAGRPRVDYSVFTGVFAGILSYFPRARRYSGHRECNAVDAPYG